MVVPLEKQSDVLHDNHNMARHPGEAATHGQCHDAMVSFLYSACVSCVAVSQHVLTVLLCWDTSQKFSVELYPSVM